MTIKCEDICLSESELEVIYTAVKNSKNKLAWNNSAWNNSFTRDYEDLGSIMNKIEKLREIK
jgi:hypothetical protein